MITPIVKKFGKRVRKLRLEQGLTQEQLGEKCGLDLTYIGRIERGEQNSSLVVIGMLAKGLGVAPELLFKGL
jgi:XRE family transcriptional regulator, regulator of sulfur utilization